MVSIMKEQDLQDMINKVVGEFQTESDFETLTIWATSAVSESASGKALSS